MQGQVSNLPLLVLKNARSRLCYIKLIKNIPSATVTQASSNAYKWFLTHGIKIQLFYGNYEVAHKGEVADLFLFEEEREEAGFRSSQ
jgi:hypothetical protein